jgi:hypothetical protein
MTERLDSRLVDKAIANRVARANGLTLATLGLRFDRVVVRLLADLRASLSKDIPDGTTVLLTMTAPIKVPGKTAEDLARRIRHWLRAEGAPREKRMTIFGNKVSVRLVKVALRQKERLVGLVHNPERDARRLLKMTADCLSTTGQGWH